MVSAYPLSFLFLFLLFQGHDRPAKDYHMAPAEAVALPYDAQRLAPWAKDFSSRMEALEDATGVEAPSADQYQSLFQTVASPSNEDLQRENEELRQRLEKLEQMLKDEVSKPPVTGAQSEESKTDKKSVPGWRVEYHPWNKDGRLANDALETILTQNCPFTGRLGLTSDNDMKIYRFMANFRVKEPGRYVFAFDTTCEFDHACTLNLSVDGEPVIEFKGKTDGQRLANGLPLVAGDHTLEFVTHLNSNRFLNYRPNQRFKWQVSVKGPSDMNPRDFAPDELFSVIPRKERMAAKPCG